MSLLKKLLDEKAKKTKKKYLLEKLSLVDTEGSNRAIKALFARK